MALVLIFATLTSRRLAAREGSLVLMGALAAAGTSVRYEFLFLVACGASMLLIRREFRASSVIVTAAAVPVLAYGLYAVAHGGLLLPNSLIMKSMPERFASVGTAVVGVADDWRAVSTLASRPALMFLAAAVSLALLLQARTSDKTSRASVWLGAMFVGAAVLHAGLVKVDWFYRYDAYLIALGILALVALRPTLNLRVITPTIVPVVTVLAVLFGQRGLPAMYATPVAAGNVDDQQGQMARLFATHYPGRVVAVNDIGMVAWAGKAPVLDLAGLASGEVARLRRSGQWNTDSLAAVVRAADVSLVCVMVRPSSTCPPIRHHGCRLVHGRSRVTSQWLMRR